MAATIGSEEPDPSLPCIPLVKEDERSCAADQDCSNARRASSNPLLSGTDQAPKASLTPSAIAFISGG